MAEIQHAGAKVLLKLIEKNGAHSGKLTYRSAARQMIAIEHEKHSRAIAQMCDLLDAAACVAGVPLLALIAVRAKNGEINPKAWTKEYKSARNAIIDRSLSHDFVAADFRAIGQALLDLDGMGNRKAWAFVNRTYGDLLYRRLIGDYADPVYSALDDLGTDDPARVLYASYSYLRDQKVRDAVLLRAKGRCEFCGEVGFRKSDGSHYLETHHVIALARDGEDRTTNVIALCPNDHRMAHFSEMREEIESKMLLKLQEFNKLLPA